MTARLPGGGLPGLSFELLEVLEDLLCVAAKQPVAGALENDVQETPLQRPVEVPLPDHLNPAAPRRRCGRELPPAAVRVVNVGVGDVGEDRAPFRPLIVAALPVVDRSRPSALRDVG